MAKSQQEHAALMLRRLGSSPALKDRQRTLAYNGIPAGLFAPDEVEFGYLLGQLDASNSFTQRSNAANALAGAKLAEAQLARLVKRLGTQGAHLAHREQLVIAVRVKGVKGAADRTDARERLLDGNAPLALGWGPRPVQRLATRGARTGDRRVSKESKE